ncbi:MAG: hypothetical protein PHX56_03420 [Atribacterota bacterium]|jgi:energy-coupling factor transporter ATP-binding protein EcfA2|nr:hypothetical protein [Atribacterota bacterium]
MRIDKLRINNFRGSSKQIEFNFENKPITLIFGENGTGKSSIVDAFDFICNQNLGSLNNISVGTNKKLYAPSIGKRLNDIAIEIISGEEKWEATYKNSIVVKPNINLPIVKILRRNEIINLISAQPKDRYEELKHFVTLPYVEKQEETLRKAVDEIDRRRTDTTRDIIKLQETLKSIFEYEENTENDYMQMANKVTEKDDSVLNKNITFYKDIIEEIDELNKKIDDWVRINETYNLLCKRLTEVNEEIQKQERDFKYNSSELLKVLEASKTYLTNNPSSKICPTCEQAIIPSELLKRISERIIKMQSLVKALRDKEDINNKINQQETILKDYWDKIRVVSKKIFDKIDILNNADLSSLCLNKDKLIAGFDPKIIEKDMDEETKMIFDFNSELTNSKIELNTLLAKELKTKNTLDIIKRSLTSINNKKKEADEQEDLFKKLHSTLQIIEETRKKYVDNTLNSISNEVDRLFDIINPKESIGNVRLFIDHLKKGSIELEGNFQGISDIPPQAYYSESHIDTLGICVFLSLAKYYKADIVILDDVITSIDNQHLERFIGLLAEEAFNFNQLIITTHYRGWRDRYRWARKSTSNIQIIELGPWTLNNGLRTGEFITAINELKQILEHIPIDRQLVASKSGLILESLLDFITYKYRLKLPRNTRNEYMLGQLIKSIDNKIKKELKIIRLSKLNSNDFIHLADLLERCYSYQWIRNCIGCHFSELGGTISDNEVIEFAKTVIELSESMICPKCHSLPTKKSSGSYWQCECKDDPIIMLPFVYPGEESSIIEDE